jgi:hypothetical protein
MTRWTAVGVAGLTAWVMAWAVCGHALPRGRMDAGRDGSPQILGAPAQSPPTATGTAAISGVVSDAATGAAIAGALVYLGPPNHGPSDQPTHVLTDSKGRFVFQRLPAFDAYFLTATKGGYFDGHYGQGDIGGFGAQLAVNDGQWFGDATIRLTRPASVTGRVIDERGEPVVGVFVRVLARFDLAGRSAIAAGPATTTDDRGVYRIGGLPTGRYLIEVPSVQSSVPTGMSEPSQGNRQEAALAADGGGALRLGRYPTPLRSIDGRLAAYPATFYPGVRTADDAAVIQLHAGDNRTSMDVRLVPVPTFTFRGHVEGAVGPVSRLTLRLLEPDMEGLGDGSEAATTLVDDLGAFAFYNVPSGTYTLEARRAVSQLELRPQSPGFMSLPRPPNSNGTYTSSAVASGPPGTLMTVWAAHGSEDAWARATVTVDPTRQEDYTLVLQPASVLSGTFSWDPEDPPGRAFPKLIRLEPGDGDVSLGMPHSLPPQVDTPTFAVRGILPGSYVLGVTGAFTIESVSWEGRDYTFRPIEIGPRQTLADVHVVLTTKSTVLTGQVHDARGDPARLAGVLVFPADPVEWRGYGLSPAKFRVTLVNSDGRFRADGVPPGDYYAIALPADQAQRWTDSAFLSSAAHLASRCALRWGQTTQLVLPLISSVPER